MKHILILIFSCAAAHSAWADDLAPIASVRPDPIKQVNTSYLSDTNGSSLPPTNHSLFGILITNPIDQKGSAELQQKYDDVTRDYLFRQSYGITTMVDQINYESNVTGLSHSVFAQAQHAEMQAPMQKITTAANNEPVIQSVKTPATVAAAAYAIYTGQPMDWKLGDASKFTFITNLQSQTGQVAWTSPFATSVFTFIPVAPVTRDPTVQSSDPNYYKDRYAFSLPKPLPVFDLRSSLSYGSTSTNLTASLTKPLMKNLSATVDSNYPTSPEMATEYPQQETVHLDYGFKF